MLRDAKPLILTLILTAALAACSSGGSPTGSGDPSGNPAPSAETLAIRVGESEIVPGTAVRIAFLRVAEDTRCALDVVCVSAGNGRVELRLSLPFGAREVSLNTTLGPRETEFAGLRIVLHALDPYPLVASPTDPDDYVATFRIEDD